MIGTTNVGRAIYCLAPEGLITRSVISINARPSRCARVGLRYLHSSTRKRTQTPVGNRWVDVEAGFHSFPAGAAPEPAMA